MTAIAALMNRMIEVNSLACCGLDPDVKRIPAQVRGGLGESDRVYNFLHEVIELAAPNVCAFKAQKAFFDNLEDGHEVLARIVAEIHSNHPGLPVFVDCKVGDIDNTMLSYTELILVKIAADGILVNPYMGDEVLAAFADYPDRAVIVLARTSNPGAAAIQDAAMQDGRLLWQYVLQLIVDRWNVNGNLIPVISSTAGLDMAGTRRLIPNDMPILLAGVGAQGGDYDDLRGLLNRDRIGVFVNSSRALLYPPNPQNLSWQQAVSRAVTDFKAALNSVR